MLTYKTPGHLIQEQVAGAVAGRAYAGTLKKRKISGV